MQPDILQLVFLGTLIAIAIGVNRIANEIRRNGGLTWLKIG